MSTESENPKSEQSRGSKRDGASHRRGRWWSRLWLPGIFSRAADWLYAFWFPYSESSHGYHGYSYGYYGRSRQNRVKWLWRRLRRLVRKSFVGSAVRALKIGGMSGGILFPTRVNIPIILLPRRSPPPSAGSGLATAETVCGPFVSQARLQNPGDRFYDWWYPASKETGAIMAWLRLRLWLWFEPSSEPAGAGLARRNAPGAPVLAWPQIPGLWPAAFMNGISRW